MKRKEMNKRACIANKKKNLWWEIWEWEHWYWTTDRRWRKVLLW